MGSGAATELDRRMRVARVALAIGWGVFAALSASACTLAPATGACSDGQESCSPDLAIALTCAGGSWEVKTTCPGADGSFCAVGNDGKASCVCVEGAIACAADRRSVQTCQGGVWTTQQSCDAQSTCSPNLVDKTAACVPSDQACDPNEDRDRCRVVVTPGDPNAKYTADAYACGGDGRWRLKQTCDESHVCIMLPNDAATIASDPKYVEHAVCQAIPCTEGVEYCPAGSSHGNPYTCTGGVLVQKATCTSTQVCIIDPNGSASCVDTLCQPGSEWCDSGSTAYVCSASGGWQLKKTCAANEYCYINAGVADCRPRCSPASTQCSSAAVVQTCGSDGQWIDTTPCTATQECVVVDGAASCQPRP